MAHLVLQRFLLICFFTCSSGRPLEHVRFQAYTRPMNSTPSPEPAPAQPTITWDQQNVLKEGPNGNIIQEENGTYSGVLASTGSCGSGNLVDDCWRCDANWEADRRALADCAVGFGRDAAGGKDGQIYTVTSADDEDAADPQPGTLRYGATREEPLWIVFATSMRIYLKQELIVASFKTIDGRGAEVHITGGAGLTLQYATHVIVHGVHLHDIKATGPGRVMSNASHVGERGVADGDAVSIFSSTHVWIDHCAFANAEDGLVDAIHGSSMITISNNLFSNHKKVMLFGAHADNTEDKEMKVTVAFNKFGAGLEQRMPRCRYGSFHIVNNDYSAGWDIYAIGGSENPTILSRGNRFVASTQKEVTKRIDDGGDLDGGYETWNWMSSGDLFENGAYFTSSGESSLSSPVYAKVFTLTARPVNSTEALAAASGPLTCTPGQLC